jgi:hypothetical protein
MPMTAAVATLAFRVENAVTQRSKVDFVMFMILFRLTSLIDETRQSRLRCRGARLAVGVENQARSNRIALPVDAVTNEPATGLKQILLRYAGIVAPYGCDHHRKALDKLRDVT